MRLWSSLSQRTKRRYKSQGVGPSAYNAWQRKPVKVRREIQKQFPNAKSGPQAAIQQKASKARKVIASVVKDYTPADVGKHAATVLPGTPIIIERVVTANASLMTKEMRDSAVGMSYAQWAALAADQSRNNPWFYHAINPGARTKSVRG